MPPEEEYEGFIQTGFGFCRYCYSKYTTPLVYNLYIEPEFRRKGNATAILQYVIAEIRRAGFTGKIEIEAIPREDSIDRESLVSFYEKMGLTVITTPVS